MFTWSNWLQSMVQPITWAVLGAMGLGYISYEALNKLFDHAVAYMRTAISGIAPEIAQILAMAGFFKAMSIILAALLVTVSIMGMKRLAVLAFGD